MIKVALLTTDSREHFKDYGNPDPYFGTAPEALLEGFKLMPKDIEIHVISCLQKKPISSPNKLANNIYYHALHVPSFGWMKTGYQGCIRAVRHKLRELQPDVVHGQGTERDCAISAAFSGLPSIVTLHGIMASVHRATGAQPFSYYRLAKILESIALKRCHGIICISTQVETFAARYSARRWLVPNAIRPAFFEASNQTYPASGIPVLVNIGTISPYKRQNELLRLLETLRTSFTFRVKFVGNVDHSTVYGRKFTEAFARARERGTDVEHIQNAAANELCKILDSSDCMVHYSSEESFGLVMAEALARNLKLFCFDVGAARSLSNLTNQCEVFAIDDEVGFASRLRAWLESYPEQPVRKNPPSLPILKQFSPDTVAHKHHQAYTELLTTKGKPFCRV
jgi:glycosyltransferase involved in cell wall biosynthesis